MTHNMQITANQKAKNIFKISRHFWKQKHDQDNASSSKARKPANATR